MKTYELTYIISSQLPSEQIDSLAKEVESLAKTQGGTVLASTKNPAQPLAYRINKQSSGHFATLIFQIEENLIQEIRKQLNQNANILRHAIIIKKAPKAVKERRTRKPLFAASKDEAVKTEIFKEIRKEEKLNPEELGKKLDEILGE